MSRHRSAISFSDKNLKFVSLRTMETPISGRQLILVMPETKLGAPMQGLILSVEQGMG